MLDNVDLDAVYLATPHHLHYGMIETAVFHHLPVFTEKPITRTLSEGQQIAQLATEKGVKVGVNYQYRYDSGCHKLVRAVQNGDLGKIHAVRINVPWHREDDYFSKSGWHRKIAMAGGGTLITQGSHFLDVVLWALQGDLPKTAVGYVAQRKFGRKRGTEVHREKRESKSVESVKPVDDIEVEDLAQGIVEMESGALIQICSSMVASSEQAVSVEVYGEKGTAVYKPSPVPHVKFRDVRVKAQKPPHSGIHALQRSLEGFRRWIIDDTPYLIPAHEALPALAVVEAIYRSAKTGKKESVR
jgi:predicted dehydrogenase